MADLKIDDATLDTEVTGGELIPASDGGNPRAIQTEKIKDFVLKRIAALASANKVDTSNDGVYLLKGGELKPVSAAVLASAVMDYAFALAPVQTITGNETVSVKDATVKKTLSLDMLKSWMLKGTVSAEEISEAVKSIENKVDKEEGKGLSDENFTLEEKQKLEGLVSNTQADWEETDDTDPSFIRNKPEIPSGLTVDEVLRPDSDNPVSSRAVAEVLEDLDAVKSLKVNGIQLDVKDGILSLDTVLHTAAPPIYPNISANPYTFCVCRTGTGVKSLYVLVPDELSGNEYKWVSVFDFSDYLMTIIDFRNRISQLESTTTKMFVFGEGECPKDGEYYPGLMAGSFVLYTESWQDGTTKHLAVNTGTENDIHLNVLSSWD